jgi:hypothetical protein
MNDLRPVYFHEARERLVGNRLAVYVALAESPATGTELAARIGWPVTSVRPRLCELRELHAAATTGNRRNGEHEFRACGHAEMQATFDAQRQQLARADHIQHDGAYAEVNQMRLFA